MQEPFPHDHLTRVIQFCCATVVVVLVIIIALATSPVLLPLIAKHSVATAEASAQTDVPSDLWQAPDSTTVPLTDEGRLISYGRDLIAHTARYLGPKGSVAQITNGMNCQNCHLKSGTKPFGNNYSAVASTYPKFRARSASMESIEKRVNDCIERSLNGKALPVNSREMHAIKAYIQWVGQSVPRGVAPKGSGLIDLPPLARPASPEKGRVIYDGKCAICHGMNGEGIRNPDSVEWRYPPLWGENSYNQGAGLYRLSRFAGYVKANMPYGASFESPQLTDEESWDVAAYVNSMPRPAKDFSEDWPDIAGKPFDHPFGPYADSFPETQHKYGPFGPIKEAIKAMKK